MKLTQTIRHMPSKCEDKGFFTKEEHTKHIILCLKGIFGDQRSYPEVEVPQSMIDRGKHNQVTWFRYSRLNKYIDPNHSEYLKVQQEGFLKEEIKDINIILSEMLEQLDNQVTLWGSSNKDIADNYRSELIPWYEFSEAVLFTVKREAAHV